MGVTRRRFVTGLLAAAGVVAAAAVGLQPLRHAYRRLRDESLPVFHRLTEAALEDTPTGPLAEQTLRTLIGATEAFIGYHIEVDHYADFFRWHAETLRGYRTLYARFSAVLDRSARSVDECAFADCETAMRRQILEPAFSVHRSNDASKGAHLGSFGQEWQRLEEREWRLFDRHIFRPIVRLFQETDAWRLAGYGAWPGTPRGINVVHNLSADGRRSRAPA